MAEKLAVSLFRQLVHQRQTFSRPISFSSTTLIVPRRAPPIWRTLFSAYIFF
jgi:hypothetical protein